MQQDDSVCSPEQPSRADEEPNPIQILERWWQFTTEPKHSNALIAIFTVLIFITGAFYTLFAGLQWVTMRGQLDQMRESLDLNKRLMRGNFSAVVVPGIGFDGNNATVNVAFANRGKSTTNTSATYEILLESLPEERPLYPPIRISITDTVVRENEAPNHYVQFSTFTNRDLGLYKASEAAIRVSGTFRYDDGFGETVTKNFCLISRAFTEQFKCEDLIRDRVGLPNNGR